MKTKPLAVAIAASLALAACWASPARAADRDTIAKVVFAEALGESQDGKDAVAAVIVNRTHAKGYPKTVEGVCHQKNAFESVTKGSKLWERVNAPLSPKDAALYAGCLQAADKALAGKGCKGVIAFRTVGCKGGEKYFSKMKEVQTIGHHRFYE